MPARSDLVAAPCGAGGALTSTLSAAAFIQRHDERVLLVRHAYGPSNWELPGGVREPHESVADCVVREVREETGLAVVPDRLAGLYYEPSRDAHHLLFVCSLVHDSTVPEPTSDEIAACGWWRSSELPRPISTFTVQRIRDGAAGAVVTLPHHVPERKYLLQGSATERWTLTV